jgi:CheY-like chemotaxis protein
VKFVLVGEKYCFFDIHYPSAYNKTIMEQQSAVAYSIVLLDDNYVIRNIIKNELYRELNRQFRGLATEVFSSGDGVAGLGYIYLTKPRIIIIDTTLPKYSGREIFDYLKSNSGYVIENTLVVLISENSTTNLGLFPQNFVILCKDKLSFLSEIIGKCVTHVANSHSLSVTPKKRTRFWARTVVFLSNIADKLNNISSIDALGPLKIFVIPILWVLWVLVEIFITPFYIFYNLSIGNILGESQIKSSPGSINYRSSKKPQVFGLIYSVGLTVFKLFLFLVVNIIILLISRQL